MKSFTEYLTFNIPSKTAFVNITPQVADAVRKSGVKEGLVLCNTMHITSSVFINDNEAGLHHDFGVWLEKLAPFNPDPNHYHHNRTGEDNADAHLKRQIMGREVVVAITKGKLDFGPWRPGAIVDPRPARSRFLTHGCDAHVKRTFPEWVPERNSGTRRWLLEPCLPVRKSRTMSAAHPRLAPRGKLALCG
jgi:secondary thiamine-phosphate synthase enzyme